MKVDLELSEATEKELVDELKSRDRLEDALDVLNINEIIDYLVSSRYVEILETDYKWNQSCISVEGINPIFIEGAVRILWYDREE